ncbi:maltose/moltooligosaccharide transporter [Mucilaginibacter frigoritolerans]|uniref:Maltose/moltooligosaccharide transporter n=1 Tax=Mucilaginibacter frigoritolerans TaxID=652788 RepID=A0A562U8X3_9SPHI|nr:MFS transporter [Mucilaginibacter frigoritolerans]TWJ02220.1 maltose/moltooligosaccharide transporter [Mucilaginibacter frigoritolerans]
MATQGILQKPKMSFWQIWNMSFGFLGIQFGFALQTGYASSILLKFGAKVDNLSWFWLAAPLTGMIIQPIIGHYSDRTWNRLGRRRPYFLTGAILSGLALCFLPNSSGLAFLIPPIIVGAGMLMLMDASFNVAMEPFRALVADNLPDSQHNTGFSLQTCLIGVGAIMGSFLPSVLAEWFHISDVAPKGIVPNNLLYSFYAGGLVLIGCILWTVIKTKEYPPEEYAKFHEPDKEVAKKSGISAFFYDLTNMPKTMRQLGVVQFFSWFALFSMWVFTTSAVAAHVYHLPASDTSSHQYSVASDWVGKMFGIYNAVSAVYALSLPFIVKKFNRKKTHAFSLTMGGIGLISIFFIQNQYLLLLSMIGVGLAWGSILAMPYAILSSSIPAKKIGLYMGLFNFFITFPQIVNSLTGSLIIKYLFHSQAIYGLIMAGIFMFLAAISVLFVQDGKDIQIIETA